MSDPVNLLGFNFVNFMDFLSANNVMAAAIAAVMSERINDMTDSFVDNILMPIINRDGDGDGESDIKCLEDKVVVIFGVKFRVGKVIVSFLKFLVITYFIFLISRIVHSK